MSDFAGAIDLYADSSASDKASKLSRTLCGSTNRRACWSFFIGTSVIASSPAKSGEIFAAFYNPWLDAALITLWEVEGKSSFIADIELVTGDILRRGILASFDKLPLWQRGTAYRPEALAQAVEKSVRAFERRFKDIPRKSWRYDLLPDKPQLEASYQITAVRLLELFLDLERFRKPETTDPEPLQLLRRAVFGMLVTIEEEGIEALLSRAEKTGPAAREALLKLHPQILRNMTVSSWMANEREGLVFLVPEKRADFTIGVYFVRDEQGFSAVRLDLLYYAGLFSQEGGKKP